MFSYVRDHRFIAIATVSCTIVKTSRFVFRSYCFFFFWFCCICAYRCCNYVFARIFLLKKYATIRPRQPYSVDSSIRPPPLPPTIGGVNRPVRVQLFKTSVRYYVTTSHRRRKRPDKNPLIHFYYQKSKFDVQFERKRSVPRTPTTLRLKPGVAINKRDLFLIVTTWNFCLHSIWLK